MHLSGTVHISAFDQDEISVYCLSWNVSVSGIQYNQYINTTTVVIIKVPFISDMWAKSQRTIALQCWPFYINLRYLHIAYPRAGVFHHIHTTHIRDKPINNNCQPFWTTKTNCAFDDKSTLLFNLLQGPVNIPYRYTVFMYIAYRQGMMKRPESRHQTKSGIRKVIQGFKKLKIMS